MEKKDIEHLATLARIELSPAEIESLRGDFDSILGYLDTIREVDTSSMTLSEPLLHNVLREDGVLVKENERENILRGFPETEGDYLKVHSVL